MLTRIYFAETKFPVLAVAAIAKLDNIKETLALEHATIAPTDNIQVMHINNAASSL